MGTDDIPEHLFPFSTSVLLKETLRDERSPDVSVAQSGR